MKECNRCKRDEAPVAVSATGQKSDMFCKLCVLRRIMQAKATSRLYIVEVIEIPRRATRVPRGKYRCEFVLQLELENNDDDDPGPLVFRERMLPFVPHPDIKVQFGLTTYKVQSVVWDDKKQTFVVDLNDVLVPNVELFAKLQELRTDGWDIHIRRGRYRMA